MEPKKVLPVLFFVMFLVMAGFGIIIPVMPFFAEKVGANPTQLGLLMAVYSLMQLIFAPVWGRISDRAGRKPVMMIGIAGLSVSFFMMAAAEELWMLFAARIVGGTLSAANMPTVMAYVADITTPEERGKGMGIIGAATGLGFVFGPAVGGIFSGYSLNTPFYIAGISSAVTLILVMLIVKESLPKERRQLNNEENKASGRQAFRGSSSILYILQMIVTLSLAGLETTFAYFAARKAGIDTISLGYMFMIMGLGGAIVQGGLVGPLTKKYGESFVIRIGILVSAAGFILILFSKDFWTAAVFLTIFGMGNGIIRPAISSLLTKNAVSGHGSATGLLSSFDSFGRIAGPPLGGWLYSIYIGLPFIAGAILSLGALLLHQFYRIKAAGVAPVFSEQHK